MSFFGFWKKTHNGDREPLLPQYEDDTSLQRTAHQKMHSFQMIKALSKGFMPSSEQVIINMRTLLASDVLNPETPGLSASGRRLVKYLKQFITEFIELLRNKNDRDQIQDFIWYLLHARVSVDTGNLMQTATNTKMLADASAAYESIKTVGSLLLTNSDFRIFMSDLNTIGRQVFADTANAVSSMAEDAAKQIEPSVETSETLRNPGNKNRTAPTGEDLVAEVAEIGNVVAKGINETSQEAVASIEEHMSGEQKDTLIYRLKAAVTKLRKRNDYSDSVGTISLLIQRYAIVYSQAVDKTINTVQDNFNTNEELDRAIKNGWSLLSSFGDKDAWIELEKRVNKVMEYSQKDPEFETLMLELSKSIQQMLTDPEFFETSHTKLVALKEKTKDLGTDSPLKKDIDDLLAQVSRVFDSVINDQDISRLFQTSLRIWLTLSPANSITNPELLTDTYAVFIPLLIQTLQKIPIPRLEISVPEIDILLENLIIEPGRTINHSSFLPFILKAQSFNNLTLHKARFQTVSTVSSMVTIKALGICLCADEVGFWLRAHKGLFCFTDEGITSFELDERGLDIEMDIEIGKDHLEKILTLKDVRVKIHHFSYTLRKSKISWLAWLLKPLLRPILRKVLERKLASSIGEFFHAANRELLFARERLRATRISDPKDLSTFFKAVLTRLKPREDPDVYTNIGIRGAAEEQGNVFVGRYTPGSVVKLWDEEAARAGEVVDDNATVQGWRNEIFNIHARTM